MRLTLRTLLAYLDDMLESTDAQELGQRIEESEFASQLVHRIRSCMRRLRLAAPKVNGKGIGLDANSVAEYLDNTLASDRVVDLEKVCLESDMHLAEVAACHQIVSLVLVTPADHEPESRHELRQRLYRLATPEGAAEALRRRAQNEGRDITSLEPSAPPLPQEPISPVTNVAVSPVPVERPSRSSGWPLAVTAAAAFVIALAGLRAMGPFDAQHPLLGGLFGSQQTAAVPSSSNSALAPPPSQAGDTPQRSGSGTDTATPGLKQPTPDAPDMDVPRPPETRPVTTEPSHVTAATRSEPAPSGRPETAVVPGAAALPAGDMPPLAGPAREALPTSDREHENATPAQPASDNAARSAPPAESPAPPAAVHFVSKSQVLARQDPSTGGWTRLAPQTEIHTGDRLLCLATFRPELNWADGLKMTLMGPSELTMQPPQPDSPQVFEVSEARLVVAAGEGTHARIRWQLPGTQKMDWTLSPGAAVALDVRRFLPPGADPETDHLRTVVEVFGLAGTCAVQTPTTGNAPLTIEAGQYGGLVDDDPPVLAARAAPPWTGDQPLDFIDREAARQLDPLLPVGAPLEGALQEQLDHRRAEVRSLVLCNLAQLDHFDPFPSALNDEDLRSYWHRQYTALQRALVRSAESARQLSAVFTRLRGTDGELMVRNLRGYSPEQLESGAAAELVRQLEHSSLDVRVVAFETLRRITGRTLNYRPERETKQRRTALVSWQKLLREGRLVYQSVPTPRGPEPPTDERPQGSGSSGP